MMRLQMVLLTGLLFMLGCSGSEHERLVTEQIRCTDEAAAILEGLKDADSANAARPKLKALLQRMGEQLQKAGRLNELAPPALQELEKKGEAALNRLKDAARQALTRPGCAEVVREFQIEFRQLGQ
jgi:hypothetical protein